MRPHLRKKKKRKEGSKRDGRGIKLLQKFEFCEKMKERELDRQSQATEHFEEDFRKANKGVFKPNYLSA